MKRRLATLFVALSSAFVAFGFASCQIIQWQPDWGFIENVNRYEIELDTTEFEPVVPYDSEFDYQSIKLIYKAYLGEEEQPFYESKISLKPNMVTGGLDTTTPGEKELIIEYGGESFLLPYVVKYQVDFLSKGEVFNTQYVLSSDEVVVPQAKEQEGYTFAYWKSEVPEVLTENVAIEAHYYNNALHAPALETIHCTYDPNATVAQLTLPSNESGNWEFVDPALPVGDAGSHEYEVRFVSKTDELAPVANELVKVQVAKKAVAAPAVSASLVYAATTQKATVTDVETDDSLYAIVNEGGINAGNYSATATLKDVKNYVWKDTDDWTEVDEVTGILTFKYTIAPKQVEFVIASETFTYNAENQFPVYTFADAFDNEHITAADVTVTGTPQVNADTYEYGFAMNNANYVGSHSGTFTIEQKELTFIVDSKSFVYDGTEHYPTYSFADPEDLPNVRVMSGKPQTEAGSGYKYGWLVMDDNYTGMHTGTFEITKPDVTVTAVLAQTEITYPAAIPEITFTVEGFAGDEALLNITAEKPTANVGTHEITPVVNNANVNATCVSATLTVKKGEAVYYRPTLSTDGLQGTAAIYGDTISTVTFNDEGFGTWAWKNPDLVIDRMSDFSAVAVFTPQDPNLNQLEKELFITNEYRQIAKRTLNIVVTKNEYTYMGEEFALEYTIVDATDPEGYTIELDKLTVSGNSVETEAGEHSKTLEIVSDYYKGVVSPKLIIQKATPVVSLTVDHGNVTYRPALTLANSGLTPIGTAHRANDDEPVEGTFTWVNGSYSLSGLAIGVATPVEVVFTPTGEKANNYNSVILTYNVTVDKADSVIQKVEGSNKVALLETYEKVYDANAFAFKAQVSRDNELPDTSTITYTYKNVATGVESATITEAGEYELTISVGATTHYNGATATVIVRITQASNEWKDGPAIRPNSSWTYKNQDSNQIFATAKFGTSTIVITYTNTTTGTEYHNADNKLPTDAEAGTYVASVVLPETSNWAGLSAEVTFTVNKAKVTTLNVGFGASNSTKYTGQAQIPTVNGSYENGSIGGVGYTVEYLNRDSIDVGTYQVRITLNDATNYVWSGTDSNVYEAEYKIEQATNQITSLSIDGWKYLEYDAAENAPVATATFGSLADISYSYYTTYPNAFNRVYEVSLDDIKVATVNTYYVRADIAATENYTAAFEIQSFNISNADLTEAQKAELFAQPYEVTWFSGITIENSGIQLPNGNYTWTNENQSLDTIGENNCEATYEIANYNAVTGNFKVTVNKAEPTLTANNGTFTYGEKTFTLDENSANSALNEYLGVSTNRSENKDAISYEISYKQTEEAVGASVNTIKNAGIYTVTVNLAESEHYTEKSTTVTITVKKVENKQTIPEMKATYGETLSKAKDSDGKTLSDYNDTYGEWSWEAGNDTLVGNATTHTYTAKYTPKAEYAGNYAGRTGVEVTVIVAKKAIALPTLTKTSFEYNGSVQKPEIPASDDYSVSGWSNENSTNVADNYTVTLRLSNENYAWSGTGTGASVSGLDATYTYAITKATLTVTENKIQTATYGDKVVEKLTLPVSTFNGNEVGTWAWLNVTNETTVGDCADKHYFEAEFTLTGDDAINFNSVSIVTIEVTVNKATPTLTVTDNCRKTYDGTAFAFAEGDITPSHNETAKISYSYQQGETVVNGLPTNAGTYTVTVTLSGSANYKGTSTTVTVIIDKAPSTINGLAESYSKVYDGYAFALTGVTDTNPEADITYTQVKNAGTHTVTVTLAETANYYGVTKTTTVVINKADNGWNAQAPTLAGWTFGETAPTLNLTGLLRSENCGTPVTLGTTVTYINVNDEAETSTTMPTQAGTYKVVIEVVGDDNWNAFTYGTNGEITFTIAKAEVTVPTLSETEYVYNKEVQKPTVGECSVAFTYAYANTESTNKGTYGVTLTITDGRNYVWAGETSNVITLTYEIKQAPNAITNFAMNGWTYNETSNSPSATANFGTPSFTYYTSEADAQNNANGTTEKPVNAGTYWVVASVEGTDNYAAAVSEPISFTIAKATFTDAQKAELFAQPYEVTWFSGITLAAISLDDHYTWDDSTTELTAGKTENYPATYKIDNYNAVTGNFTVTVNKITSTVTASDKSFTYDKDVSYTAETLGGLIGVTVTRKDGVNNGTDVNEITYVISYKANETAESETVTTIHNAGIYTVTVNLAESEHFTSATTTVTITVKKVENNLTQNYINSMTATYGTKLKDLSLDALAAYNVGGTWQWVNPEDTVGNVTVGNAYNKHEIKFVPTDSNYAPKTGLYVNVAVKATAIALPTLTNSFVYNGSVQKPEIPVSDDYTVAWADENRKNVGSYTVTLTLTDSNYAWSGTGTGASVSGLKATYTYAITKAPVTVSLTLINYTWVYGHYNAEENKLEATVTKSFTDSVAVAYRYATNNDGSDLIASFAPNTQSVGKYYVQAYVIGTENYDGAESAWTEFTITEQVISDIAKIKGDFTYDGTAKATAVSGAGYTMVFTKGDSTYTQAIDAGTYTVTITAKANYTLAESVANGYTFTVTQATVEIADKTAEFTYDGSEHTPEYAVKVVDGAAIASTNYTDTVVAQTDAGDYAFTVTLTNANYTFANAQNSVAVDFVIHKATWTGSTEYAHSTEIEWFNGLTPATSGITLPTGYAWRSEEVANTALVPNDETALTILATYTDISGNYDSIDATVTVNVKRVQVTLTEEAMQTAFTYDGTSYAVGDIVTVRASSTKFDMANCTVEWASGTDSEGKITNAGTYALSITWAEEWDTYFDITKDQTPVKITIEQATPTATVENVAVGAYLSGLQEQIGNPAYGTWDWDWTHATDIHFTDAKTYECKVPFHTNSNNYKREGIITVYVGKAAVSATIALESNVYTGSEIRYTVTVGNTVDTLTEGTQYTVTCDTIQDAGEYTVTITLLDATFEDYLWATTDSTVTIQGAVLKKKITIASATNGWTEGTPVLSDEDRTWKYLDPQVTLSSLALISDSDTSAGITSTVTYYKKSGDSWTKEDTWTAIPQNADVGEYKVVISVPYDSNGNWTQVDDVEILFTITPKAITPTLSGAAKLVYKTTAQTVTLSPVEGYSVACVGAKATSAVTIDGYEIQVKNADTYTVTLTLDESGNYTWSSDLTGWTKHTDGTLTRTFVVAPKTIEKDAYITALEALQTSTPEYDGTTDHIGSLKSHTGTGYSAAITSAKSFWNLDIAEAQKGIDAGTYKIALTIDGSGNYVFANDLATEYVITISQKVVTLTERSTTYSGREYMGDLVSLTVDGEAYGEYYANCEKTIKDAGEYTVSVSLANANYKFADGGISKEDVTFEVKKAGVEVTMMKEANEFVYNPTKTWTAEIAVTSDVEVQYTIYDKDENVVPVDEGKAQVSAQEAGTYTYTVTLTDTKNFEFADGTSSKTVSFTIAPKKVTAPVIENTEVSYDPTRSESIIPVTAGSYEGYTVSVAATSDGTRTGIDTGTYTVTLTLDGSGNYVWNGTPTKQATYTITAITVDVSSLELSDNHSLKYNGSYKLPVNAGNSEDGIYKAEIVGKLLNSETPVPETHIGTYAGTYTVTLTLLDTVNYRWSTGDVAPYKYTINKATVTTTNEPQTLTYGDTFEKVKLPTSNVGTWSWTEDYSATVLNASTTAYKFIAKCELSGADAVNYSAVANVTVSVTVNKAELTVTAYDKEVTYKASAYTVDEVADFTVSGASTDKSLINVTCDKTMLNAETYTLTFASADSNYKLTNPEVTATVTIAPAKITAELTGAQLVYNESEQTKGFVFKDSKGEVIALTEGTGKDYTVTGHKQTNAGNYEIKIKLSGNYKFAANTPDLSYTIGKATNGWTEGTPVLSDEDRTWKYLDPQVTLSSLALISDSDTSAGITSTVTYYKKSGDSWTEEDTWTAIPQNADVGEYKVVISVPYDSNGNWTQVDDVEILFTITPKAITPQLSAENLVYNKDAQIVTASTEEGVDFTVACANATVNDNSISVTNAGDYTVVFTLTSNNYVWKDNVNTVSLAVARKQIKATDVAAIANATKTVDYGGANKLPALTGYEGFEAEITKAEAFAGTIVNKGVDAGNYTLTLKLTDATNYEFADGLTLTYDFTINRAKATATITNTSATYDRNEHSQTISVTSGVKYKVNGGDEITGDHTVTKTNAGTYTYAITLVDTTNFELTAGSELTFTINKATVGTVQLAQNEFTYTGKPAALSYTVQTMDRTITLAAGTDYTTNDVETNVGNNYELVITLSNNFVFNGGGNTQTLTYSITKATATITLTLTNYTWQYGQYNAEANKLEATVTKSFTDSVEVAYKYATNSNGTGIIENFAPNTQNAGTYYVQAYAAGTDNYDVTASAWTEFIITEQVISSITKIEGDFTYDGTAKATAASGTGYTMTFTKGGVKYSEAVDAGTYTVTITAATNYKLASTVDKNYTFTINPAAATLTVPTTSFEYTGSAIEVPVTVTATVNGETVTLTKDTDYTVSGYQTNANENGKSYTLTVTLTNGNYTFASGTTATQSYTITKKSITYSGETAINVPYGTTFESMALPTSTYGTWAWPKTGAVGDAGEYEYTVTFTPSETYKANYAVVTQKVKVTVTLTKTEVASPTDQTYTYNGTNYIPAATADYTVSVTKGGETVTEMINAGTYTVTFTLNDSDHYKWSDSENASIERTYKINPATATVSISGDNSFTYNGDPHSVNIVVKAGETTLTGGYTVEGNGQTNAGTHTITVTLTNANYTFGTSNVATKSYTIAKAEVAYNGQTAFSVPYGTKIEDVTIGATSDYGTWAWTTTGAVGNASETPYDYTVKFTPSAEYATNYAEVTQTVKVTVTKIDNTITTFTVANKTYDGTAVTPTLEADYTEGAAYTYSGTKADGTTVSKVSGLPIDAGEYTVYVTIAASTNYNRAEAYVSGIIISPAELTINISMKPDTAVDGYYYQNQLAPILSDQIVYTATGVLDENVTGTLEITEELTFISKTSSYFGTKFTPNSANYKAVSSTVNIKLQSVAHIDSTYYGTIEAALAAATSGQTVYVVPDKTGKVVITEDCEIKSGVTLCLPYEGTTYFDNYSATKTLGFADASTTSVTNNRKSLVTLDANTTLTVNGTLLIGGKLGSASAGLSGHTSGSYAEICMGSNARIVSYGTVNCYGYIKETARNNGSMVEIVSGTAYAPYVIYDFKGGSDTVCVYQAGNMSPFAVYDMPNVQPFFTIHAAATLIGYADLYANDTHNSTSVNIIAKSGAILNLSDGATATLKYTPQTNGLTTNYTANASVTLSKDVSIELSNRTVLTYANGTEFKCATTDIQICGGAYLGTMSMTVMGATVKTETVLFPISWKQQMTLRKGTYEIAKPFKLLSGATIAVEEGATLNVKSSMVIYPMSSLASQYNGVMTDDVYYFNNIVAYPAKDAAQLLVKGALNISDTSVNSSFGGFGGIVTASGPNAVLNVTSSASNLTATSTESKGTVTGISAMFNPKCEPVEIITKTFQALSFTQEEQYFTASGTYYGAQCTGGTYAWVESNETFNLGFKFGYMVNDAFRSDLGGYTIVNNADVPFKYTDHVYPGSAAISEKVTIDGVEYYLIFKGWYTKAGTVEETYRIRDFYGKDYVRGVTLYGVFEAVTSAYTVNFDVSSSATTVDDGLSVDSINIGGDSISGFNPMTETAYAYSAINNDQTKDYYLEGWYLNGVRIDPENLNDRALTVEDFGATASITLTANWVKKETIAFVTNDSAISIATVYVTPERIGDFNVNEHAKAIYANDDKTEKAQYFGGWYTNSGYTGDPVTTLGEGATLYAKWLDKAAITFVTNDSKISIATAHVKPDSLAAFDLASYANDAISVYDNVYSASLSFGGWYTDSGFTGDPVTRLSESGTVYAKWLKKALIQIDLNAPSDFGQTGIQQVYLTEAQATLFEASMLNKLFATATYDANKAKASYFNGWQDANGDKLEKLPSFEELRSLQDASTPYTVYGTWSKKYIVTIVPNCPSDMTEKPATSNITIYLNPDQVVGELTDAYTFICDNTSFAEAENNVNVNYYFTSASSSATLPVEFTPGGTITLTATWTEKFEIKLTVEASKGVAWAPKTATATITITTSDGTKLVDTQSISVENIVVVKQSKSVTYYVTGTQKVTINATSANSTGIKLDATINASTTITVSKS